MQRILTVNRPKCAPIEQPPQGGVTPFREGGTLAHAPTTFLRLRVETDEGGEAFTRALPSRQGLPAVQLHPKGQDDFATDAGQGQQPLRVVLQMRMLLLVVRNRLLNLRQSILQCLHHPFQIGNDWRSNAWPTAQSAQPILFLLEHLLQILTTLQQAVQFTYLKRQWLLGCGLLRRAEAANNNASWRSVFARCPVPCAHFRTCRGLGRLIDQPCSWAKVTTGS